MLRCIHSVNNGGECSACGQVLRLKVFRLMLQPLFEDAEHGGTYGPQTMPTTRITPEVLAQLIATPEAAAETLRRLSEVKGDGND